MAGYYTLLAAAIIFIMMSLSMARMEELCLARSFPFFRTLIRDQCSY